MVRPMRTTPCDAGDAQRRLLAARAYLDAADHALRDDRDEYAAVAAGNAVLAGIAAADAICCAGLGVCSRDQDHRQATELLATATSDGRIYKSALLRLLDLKDAAQYGFGGFSKANAKRAVRLARTLVEGADSVLQR